VLRWCSSQDPGRPFRVRRSGLAANPSNYEHPLVLGSNEFYVEDYICLLIVQWNNRCLTHRLTFYTRDFPLFQR
jgi:hypothetical protein